MSCSLEKTHFDDLECHLVDITRQKCHQYLATRNSFGERPIPPSAEIKSVPEETVKKIHGKNKVKKVYKATEKHVEDLAEYHVLFPFSRARWLGCYHWKQ